MLSRTYNSCACRSRARNSLTALAGLCVAAALLRSAGLTAAGPSLQAPEQFIGFKVGADNKLARWDKIVDYMKLVAAGSDRVRYRELGKTSQGNSLIALEIASPDTLKNLDRYKQLERRLYLPERRAERARSRRNLPPGQGGRPHHLRDARDRNRLHASLRSSSCTSWRPTTRRR